MGRYTTERHGPRWRACALLNKILVDNLRVNSKFDSEFAGGAADSIGPGPRCPRPVCIARQAHSIAVTGSRHSVTRVAVAVFRVGVTAPVPVAGLGQPIRPSRLAGAQRARATAAMAIYEMSAAVGAAATPAGAACSARTQAYWQHISRHGGTHLPLGHAERRQQPLCLDLGQAEALHERRARARCGVSEVRDFVRLRHQHGRVEYSHVPLPLR
jgi:hypothetical protein